MTKNRFHLGDLTNLIGAATLVGAMVAVGAVAGCFSYSSKTTEPAVAVEPLPATSESTTTTTTSPADSSAVEKHSTTTFSAMP